MFLFHQTFQRLCSAVISLLTGPTDTLISCPIRVPKTATKAQTPWRKGLEEKRRRIKSLGHGFVNSQIWILLWLFWADRDHYVPKVWTMLFGRRFFFIFQLWQKEDMSDNMQRVLCLWHYSEYRKILCGRMRVRHWCGKSLTRWKHIARLSGWGKNEHCNTSEMSSSLLFFS